MDQGWAVLTLRRYADRRTGRWRMPTGEAWQPALAVSALLAAGDGAAAARSFARYRGRRSRFHDDDGWYLAAWLDAFDGTGEEAYLTEAAALFAAMARGWDTRGGLWWSEARDYRNAITNELFLLAAAGLARRTGERGYRDWADRAWAWFDASGLINADRLVNDGLDAHGRNNAGTTWTYNQGVILGALVELWRGTGDDALLARAGGIAEATLAALTDAGGILREPSEGGPRNRDADAFKGIFCHHLARLDAVRPRPGYHQFLGANAAAAWSGRHPVLGVGLSWGRRALAGPGRWAPAGPVNGATHVSATLLMLAAAARGSGQQDAQTPDHQDEQGRAELDEQ